MEGHFWVHEKRACFPSFAKASTAWTEPKYESPTMTDFSGRCLAGHVTVSCVSSGGLSFPLTSTLRNMEKDTKYPE